MRYAFNFHGVNFMLSLCCTNVFSQLFSVSEEAESEDESLGEMKREEEQERNVKQQGNLKKENETEQKRGKEE